MILSLVVVKVVLMSFWDSSIQIVLVRYVLDDLGAEVPAEVLQWSLNEVRGRVLVLSQVWVVQVSLLPGSSPGCWLPILGGSLGIIIIDCS